VETAADAERASPQGGPTREVCDGTGDLAGWLLRDRAAELQRLIPLLAAARREGYDGAEERHNGDFLATHDSTSVLFISPVNFTRGP
jgi:hypothetical protein